MYRALVVVGVVLFAAPAFAQVGVPIFEQESQTMTPRDVSGSYCTTADPYVLGGTATMCWTCFNGGPTEPDPEWLTGIALGYPDGWTVACGTQDGADSGANPVAFSCGAAGQTVTYADTDAGLGEISPQQSWGFCVAATAPAVVPQPVCVFFTIAGDGEGSVPHDIILCDGVVPVELQTFSAE